MNGLYQILGLLLTALCDAIVIYFPVFNGQPQKVVESGTDRHAVLSATGCGECTECRKFHVNALPVRS